MDATTIVIVVLVIATALTFDFTNGFHDTANAMATSIATGALKPKTAVIAAGALNLVGAFLSTEVAKTISGGIINEDAVHIGPEFIFAGLIGAIVWNMLTWLVGLPSSSSHALFGGLVGAVVVGAGFSGVNFLAVLDKVLLPALISPFVAGLAAWLAVRLVLWIVRGMSRKRVEDGFRHGQTITALLVALSHGTNDAQKTMGIITLTLITAGMQESGSGPGLWVVAACGLAIALGTYSGGWRVIRTLGKGLTEITTPQGFASEVSSATTILVSSHLGFALSTTQVCSGSIVGAGLGRKGSPVRWGVAGRMVVGWIVTFPAAGVVGAAACALAKINIWGTLGVALIAAAIIWGIYRLSKRNPVTAANVNATPAPAPVAAA
jgi:PiT family inorganic phosphate transporter